MAHLFDFASQCASDNDSLDGDNLQLACRRIVDTNIVLQLALRAAITLFLCDIVEARMIRRLEEQFGTFALWEDLCALVWGE